MPHKLQTVTLSMLLLTLGVMASTQPALTRESVEKELFQLALLQTDRSLLTADYKNIVRLGPSAIPVLVEIFSDESYAFGSSRPLAYPIRLLAGLSLGEFKPILNDQQIKVFVALRQMQIHRKQDIREIAITSLYRLGDEAPLKTRMKNMYGKIRQQHAQLDLYQQQGEMILVRRVRYNLAIEYNDLAILYLRIYDKQRCKNLLEQAISNDPNISDCHYNLACVYASFGEIEKGLDSLSRAIDVGYMDLLWLQIDRDLQSLHAHPRFAQIVQKLAQKLQNHSE